MTGNPVEVVFAPFEVEADHLDQFFMATGEVLAESEEALAVLAESI